MDWRRTFRLILAPRPNFGREACAQPALDPVSHPVQQVELMMAFADGVFLAVTLPFCPAPMVRLGLATRLVQSNNTLHGTAFTLGGRYSPGEQGAFALSQGNGDGAQQCVLKRERGTEVPARLRRAVDTTSRLRAVGYPAPRYRLIGVAVALSGVYSIQEALPGNPT